METLIKMTAFVKEQYELFIQDKITCEQFRERVWKYANFLSLTPEIWMFVPCDSDGNILEEPEKFKNWTNFDYSGTDIGFEDERLCREYQTAKERCYFEGFELDVKTSNIVGITNVSTQIWFYKNGIITVNAKEIETIEYLIDYNLTLTATALKEIGL